MAKKNILVRKSWYQSLVMETLLPLLLIVLTPLFLLVYIHFSVECRSRLECATGRGVLPYLQKVLSQAIFTDKQSWLCVLAFAAWSAFAPLVIGGKKFSGPPTITGFQPRYIDSGFRFFLLSTVVIGGAIYLLPVGWTWYLKLFPLACTTTIFGFIFCVFLFVKGALYPSLGEHGSSGNLLFDFYWGKELYPKIGKLWYLKEWAVAFYGMMGWFLVVLVCWKAQYEQIGWNWAMATSCLTLTIYMGKFYWWYQGYLNSLDIIYDRTGFYLGWGGVGLMPTFLACHAVYMVENPSSLGPITCLTFTALGICFTYLTYWADIQRLDVRRTDGKCKVWGQPAKVIRVTYKDARGRDRASLLLASGFWGLARHPNYVLEFVTNLMWMVPAGVDSVIPYLWGLFLFGIFVQRIGRDDQRCRKKYERFWEKYCEEVPYVLIPGIM